MNNPRHTRSPLMGVAVAVAIAAGLASTLMGRPSHSAPTQAVTAPPPAGRQEATFAAGCFWSMEAIFKQLKGVDKVLPGYSGGTAPHPSYEQVEEGNTGYAESLDIIYDPKVVSYRELLQVLLVARDPTTLDRQGPDEGSQYRSVIFYRNAAQKQSAEQAIAEVNAAHTWQKPIVTAVAPFTSFYRAEDYHLNYYNLHPDQGYCAAVIAPEIAEFRAKFKSELK